MSGPAGHSAAAGDRTVIGQGVKACFTGIGEVLFRRRPGDEAVTSEIPVAFSKQSYPEMRMKSRWKIAERKSY